MVLHSTRVLWGAAPLRGLHFTVLSAAALDTLPVVGERHHVTLPLVRKITR